MSYRIAGPDEYLAVTGAGISTVKICKKAFIWPLQRCMKFSVHPHDYVLDLQAMTKEKLQFLLPVVFTVGPDVNARGANHRGNAPGGGVGGLVGDGEHGQQHVDNEQQGHEEARGREDRGDALMKYAMLLADEASAKNDGDKPQFIVNIVKGIIEGETRVLVSSMTMEEIFTEREVFKRRIFRNIQGELDQFGLKIYNANVKELRDAPNSVYFESLSRKAHEGATNQARIDVAEAQLRGNVGEAQRRGEQDREIAKINAETAVQKTDRDAERATAESNLARRKAALQQTVDTAQIEATRATEARDEDLKREVGQKRAAAELERLRATDLVKATIARESQQQAADARAYEVEADARAQFEQSVKNTDAQAYRTRIDAQTEAEATFSRTTKAADAQAYKTRAEAEAAAFATREQAQAGLERTLREAEGMAAMADAYGRLSAAFGGPAGLLQYMMIEKGTYVELAAANARAIQGLNPKISVWNTGAEAGAAEGANGQSSSTQTMRNVYQMLPPLMSTINEQTGITLPEWQFGRLAGAINEKERQGNGTANGKK